jgi:hypothetical protein
MRAFLACLVILLSGCATVAVADSPRADLVVASGTAGRLASSGNEGRRRAPWVEVAGDRDAFVDLWNRFIPGDAAVERIDFGKDLAVFLLLGPQPTGGYAIEPFDVKVEEKAIRIRAKLVQPMKPDEFTSQSISAPYAVVRAPRVVYERIEWIDADGRLLATRTAE